MNLAGNKLPILCNQENFLLRSNNYLLDKSFPNCHIVFKPASKETFLGRPKNGMFIAVPDCMKDAIRDVSPNHWRLQAITITVGQCTILVISCYFPNNPNTVEFDEEPLQEVFNYIQETIENVEFDYFFLAGDLNANFMKASTGHVKCVRQFFNNLDIVHSWENYDIDFTHTHELDGVTFVSTIDHFYWCHSLNQFIEDAGAIHSLSLIHI